MSETSFVRQLVPTRRRRHAPVAPKTTTSYACESRCDMRFLGYSGRHVHVWNQVFDLVGLTSLAWSSAFSSRKRAFSTRSSARSARSLSNSA